MTNIDVRMDAYRRGYREGLEDERQLLLQILVEVIKDRDADLTIDKLYDVFISELNNSQALIGDNHVGR